MKTRNISLFLSIMSSFSLFSCKSSLNNNCYQCYIGNMIVSSFTMPYAKISDHPCLVKTKDEEINSKAFYYNTYVINTERELTSFYSLSGVSVDTKEITDNNPLTADKMIVYIISQIPAGYKAYKRDNIQQTGNDGKVVLITDNFYYYASRPEISYCNIDLKKDDTVKDDYSYSFYYSLYTDYSSIIKEDSIRVILNETAD